MSALRSMNTSPTRPSPLRYELEFPTPKMGATNALASDAVDFLSNQYNKLRLIDKDREGEDSGGESSSYEGLEEAVGAVVKNQQGGRSSPGSTVSAGSFGFRQDENTHSSAQTPINNHQQSGFQMRGKEALDFSLPKEPASMLGHGPPPRRMSRSQDTSARPPSIGRSRGNSTDRLIGTTAPYYFNAEHIGDNFPSYGIHTSQVDLSKSVDAALFSFNSATPMASTNIHGFDSSAYNVRPFSPRQRADFQPTSPYISPYQTKLPTPPPDGTSIALDKFTPPVSTSSNFDLPAQPLSNLPTISGKRFLRCRLLNCHLTRVLSIVSDDLVNNDKKVKDSIDYVGMEFDGYNLVDCEVFACSRVNTPGSGLPEYGVENVGGGMEYIDRA